MMNQDAIRRLYRSRTDRRMTGVSGGLAHYLNVDPTLVRIGWVVATVVTGPGAVAAYLLLSAIIPNEPTEPVGLTASETYVI